MDRSGHSAQSNMSDSLQNYQMHKIPSLDQDCHRFVLERDPKDKWLFKPMVQLETIMHGKYMTNLSGNKHSIGNIDIVALVY